MQPVPLFNPHETKEWIELIGKYISNMGSLELVTRDWIFRLTNETKGIYTSALSKRIEYIEKRLPNGLANDSIVSERFRIAQLHCKFRNIVAHSALLMSGNEDKVVLGLLNLVPETNSDAELISYEELNGRVNESAIIGQKFFDMYNYNSD